MSKIQTIVGLLLFLIILFSMNMIFGNVLKESFTQNIKISSPTNKKKYSRLSTQNQNDDQPLFFGFS
jgi:hypothetical protein